MNEFKALTLNELKNLYGINKLIHTKDKKAKRNCILLTAVWAMLIGMVVFYVNMLTSALIKAGLNDIIFSHLTVIASLLIFFFGIFRAGSSLFDNSGCDILFSLPVKQRSIAFSRFIFMYIENLLFALLIMVSGIATYAYYIKPDFIFYPTVIISCLFIPLIPLAASCFFGMAVTAISARLKHKNAMQIVLSLAFMFGIMALSFLSGYFSSEITPEMLVDISVTLDGLFKKLYLPSVWVNTAATKGNLLYLLMFILLSAALSAVTVWVVSLRLQKIIEALHRHKTKSNYKISEMKNKSILSALYRRELKRYFSSSIYVLNTIMGPVMAAIASVALVVSGDDLVAAVRYLKITKFVPFVLSTMLCMMTTSSSSISLEGKQVQFILSLPIPMKKLFDSKILLNISLMLPFYIISEVALIIAFSPTFYEALIFIFIPMVLVLFSVVFGITINIKMHNFNWENEAQIVKQSASSMLGGFIGPVIAIAVCFLGIKFPGYGNIIILAATALIILTTVVLYQKNNKAVLSY